MVSSLIVIPFFTNYVGLPEELIQMKTKVEFNKVAAIYQPDEWLNPESKFLIQQKVRSLIKL